MLVLLKNIITSSEMKENKKAPPFHDSPDEKKNLRKWLIFILIRLKDSIFLCSQFVRLPRNNTKSRIQIVHLRACTSKQKQSKTKGKKQRNRVNMRIGGFLSMKWSKNQ